MVKQVIAALAAVAVMAGFGGGASAAPLAAHHSNTSTNMMDAQFAKMAAMGGTAEVELSKVALRRSNSKAVQRFAGKMIHDHTVLGHDLMVTARPLGLSTPMVMDSQHRAIRARLARLSGNSLNSAYLNAMIVDHTKTVGLFQKEIAYGKNIHMTNLATKSINAIQNHLQMAHDVSGTQNKPSRIKNPPTSAM